MVIILHILTIVSTYFVTNFIGFDFTVINDLPLNILFTILIYFGVFFVVFILYLIVLTLQAYLPYNKHNNHIHNKIRRAYKIASYMLSTKVVVTGKENLPKKGEVFTVYPNHSFDFDIIALTLAFKKNNVVFVAKNSLFKIPMVGRYMRKNGTIGIDPLSVRSGAESIIKAIKTVKDGLPVIIFPEGKRTFSNKTVDFKPGSFKLAYKSNSTIYPVSINDSYKVGKRFPLFRIRKLKVNVHIHEPIKYDDYKDIDTQTLAVKVKDIVDSKLVVE